MGRNLPYSLGSRGGAVRGGRGRGGGSQNNITSQTQDLIQRRKFPLKTQFFTLIDAVHFNVLMIFIQAYSFLIV